MIHFKYILRLALKAKYKQIYFYGVSWGKITTLTFFLDTQVSLAPTHVSW